jgi:hypothetical protein
MERRSRKIKPPGLQVVRVGFLRVEDPMWEGFEFVPFRRKGGSAGEEGTRWCVLGLPRVNQGGGRGRIQSSYLDRRPKTRHPMSSGGEGKVG